MKQFPAYEKGPLMEPRLEAGGCSCRSEQSGRALASACFICGRLHMMRDCPKRGRLTTMIVEVPAEEMLHIGALVVVLSDKAAGSSKRCSHAGGASTTNSD